MFWKPLISRAENQVQRCFPGRQAGKDEQPAEDGQPPTVEAKNTTAMLTTFNEVDMSAIMDIRKNTRIPSRRNMV